MANGHDQGRAQLLEVLMAKVADETYPSTTMLDIIEDLLTPDDVDAYADILLGHVKEDRFPSLPMIARLQNLYG